MSSVFWVFEAVVKQGQGDALKQLVREMADASYANEPETLIYQWTISEDGTKAEVHERYASSEAALRHLDSFNKNFADRLMAMIDPVRMTVYGSPNRQLKDQLSGAGPYYMEVFGGFAR